MPDFRLQPSFPIASVVDAASRNAQLQEQSREAGNKSIIEGLQGIGQVGQSLLNTRKRVAQSLALGKQFDVPEELSRTLEPAQVLEAAKIKQHMTDAGFAVNAWRAQLGLPPLPGATTQAPADATPASQNTPAPTGGAMLTSDTKTTPLPESNGSAPSAPAAGGSMPVPMQAPPIAPGMPKQLNPIQVKLLQHMVDTNQKENVYTNDNGALTLTGQVPKGSKVLPSQSNVDKKEQDAYWREGVRGIQSIRGDTPMKEIESQRNSAITAYNRLRDIEYTGKAPNPIDYVDILGQVYKARTGQAPGEIVLKDAKQATSIGQLGKFWTFATGQQMPATSKEIAGSIKDMVAHMGLQADDLHEGYMRVHGSEVFNPNMSADNVAKLSKVARGKSFTEATGAKPEDFDPHVKAIQWAQSHPNDPRSGQIMQKAMQAKGGGQIGL